MGSISCGASLIKCLLFLFNVVWLALGAVILWLGFEIAKWGGDLTELFDNNLKTGAVVVLTAGFLIFLLAFLGCCGAVKQNSCMLTTYGALILVLVVLQCVGAYFAFANKTDIESKLKDAVKTEFSKWNQSPAEGVAKSIQIVQSQFECCGIDGPQSYTTPLPASCCGQWERGDDAKKQCSGAVKYTAGCVDKVTSTLNGYLGGLGGVAIALVLIQLLIVLSACCLAREVRN